MTKTEIFKAIELHYGSGALMAFADLIESENMNTYMDTYTTFAEAKIANPKMRVGIVGEGAFISVIDGNVPFKICNPADYCMTVEQFLKANGELPDGALILHHDGSYNILIDNYMKGICSHDSDSFVIEVPVLEQPKQEVEWDGEGLPPVGCMIKTKDGIAKVLSTSEEEGGVVTYSWDNGMNIACCWNNKSWVNPVDKPKSERELVIEQACKLIPTTAEEDIKIISKLYDLGMLKLIQE